MTELSKLAQLHMSLFPLLDWWVDPSMPFLRQLHEYQRTEILTRPFEA